MAFTVIRHGITKDGFICVVTGMNNGRFDAVVQEYTTYADGSTHMVRESVKASEVDANKVYLEWYNKAWRLV